MDNPLPALTRNAALRTAAGGHAADMVRRRYFAHVSPGGTDLVDRARAAGYLRPSARNWALGEALAWRPPKTATPRGALRGLLRSAPHRRLLLSRAFREAGVAVRAGAPKGSYRGATFVVSLGRR